MTPTTDRHEQVISLEDSRHAGGLIGASLIMTAMGERMVAALAPGDRVITRDRGMVVLEDIRRRVVTAPVVRIAARSLGHNRPEYDTFLPVGHRVLIRDWRAKAVFGQSGNALVPVERLVDGEFVTLEEPREMGVYDLMFSDPHILYVDGLEVSTYLDEHAYF